MSNTSTPSNPMWGGRFESASDKMMEAINASIGFDKKMYAQDIRASIVHAAMLAQQGIISQEDRAAITKGLLQIQGEIESGQFTFQTALEDIHMNVESRLAELIGPAAGRLHTARSRNDQVATDFRLWVRDMVDAIAQQIEAVQQAFVLRAQEHAATLMPGFTHLQTAQPVTLGHHFMAYVEMLGRDHSRFVDARNRMNECPLGSAALAGTSFPIDRHFVAKELGFARPTANSLDSVSDRDFALEAMAAASITAMHLSRFAEEIVVWCSAPFHFISLSDKYSTGSSIMPQKRNPDAAELVRAKIGRIAGHFQGLLMVMKGLPLAYSKDMQEDKEATFDALETLSLCLAVMEGMVADIQVNAPALKAAASGGYSTATELADWLVQALGIPFRQAHHITGRAVKLAEDAKKPLHKLTLAQLQSIEPTITNDVFKVLTAEAAIKRRISFGGTAPKNVRAQAARWRKTLG